MFLKTSFADEIARSMAQNLQERALSSHASAEGKLVKAAEHLNQIAELFDELGLETESEIATALLQNIVFEKTAKKKRPQRLNDALKEQIEENDKNQKNSKKKNKKVKNQFETLREMGTGKKASKDGCDENCAFCGSHGSDDNHAFDDETDMEMLDEGSPDSDHVKSNEELLRVLHDLKREKDSDDDFEDEWDADLPHNDELDQRI